MKKIIGLVLCGLAGLVMAAGAEAATCTTLAGTGTWATATTWSCGRIPTTADTVVISRAITLSANYTIAGLTVNSGITFNDGGSTLTITPNGTNGDLTNNGTITGGGNIGVTGATAIISGTGTYTNSRLYITGTATTIPAGAILNFTGSSRLYAGRTTGGATVAASVLTINGTINSTIPTTTTTFLRLYANSTVIGSAGIINASVSAVTYNTTTATVTNNGSVNVQIITQSGTTNTNSWTQGVNSSLTVSAVSTVGTLYASANGNTVTYTSPATPITPNSNTYYNLAGTGVTCPTTFTISGTSPCAVAAGTVTVTLNPGSCANATGIGTVAWAPSPTTNVNLNDALYATSTVNGTSNYLKCTGYGFAIPATATIMGITVNVVRKSSATTRTSDGAMRLVKAGVIGTIDRSTTTVYTTADVIEAHGTSTDLWGVAWTPADINLATFGAAFAAKTTRNRIVSVNHMPISVTYSVPPAVPHHIQIDHDGSGQTCRAETLTVTACANAACTAPHFNLATVTGNVTWFGSPGGSIPFTIASGGMGQTTVLLPVTTAQTVTLGTSSIFPAQTNPPSTCTNSSGGAACSIVFSSASACFDAVEVGAAIATPLFTKLSGTTFSLDVLAASTYSGTLQVELVNSSTGSCATYASLNPPNIQSTIFTSQTKKTLSFTYANAAKDVKVRITGLAASSCSTGKLAIRPQSLMVTSSANADATGTNPSATTVVKAGAAFTLNATAIAGYDGTPVLDNAKVLAHAAAVANGTVFGVFGAANPATGAATGSSFGYDEVGYFKMDVDGVYDNTFTAVDSAAGDCTPDFSNTLVGGKYGCYFGNAAATNYFGRFIPDHFTTSVTMDCSTFAYSGQPLVDFSVTAVAAVPAGSPAGTVGATTQNYAGNYAKAVTLSDALNTGLGALSPASVASSLFTGGIATPAVMPAYTFTNVKTAPTDIRVKAIEATGPDFVSTVTGAEGVMKVRSGRVWMSNVYGSELLDLSVPVFAQYWNGSSFVTNVDDDVASCTSFVKPTATLQPGGAALTVTMPSDLTVPGNVGFTAGDGSMILTKPGVAGYADVTPNVPAWLQFAWSGTVPAKPTARATFGVYGGSTLFVYRGRHGR